MADSSLIPVDLVALVEDQASSSPIVILHDRRQNRLLPIWIGDPEARAIAIALNRMSTPRPMTHALVLQIIEKMNGKLSRIVVDRLKNNTYFASLHINMTERAISIDARPSDAIAVALFSQQEMAKLKELLEKARERERKSGGER
ncbi:bifunctional nuclease family protein [Candidatus Peregrinibacteria bacterium]|nr:bifunctional nuclease family protein [Candidatus Peregrinibacteria bacterium]